MAAVLVDQRHGRDAQILVMPSDHLIEEEDAFHEAVTVASCAAASGLLVTFGVKPTGPETGYGYLEMGDALDQGGGVFTVARFTEKPAREVAEAMVADGRHYWNGGIFLYTVGAFLTEAEQLAPDIAHCAGEAIATACTDGFIVEPAPAALDPCPSISVDYAIMEKADRVAMVPFDAGWSDVGSWDAVANLPLPPLDDRLVSMLNSNNCYIRTDGIKLNLLGVDDLVVVATGDRVLMPSASEGRRVSLPEASIYQSRWTGSHRMARVDW
jgi:mannose-1-phosphate guanylyltransferase/mannose-1-phosphate guanylyltransferase/mannose-6-phosphate isomerase